LEVSVKNSGKLIFDRLSYMDVRNVFMFILPITKTFGKKKVIKLTNKMQL
jgi:hypothetical protein